MVELSKEEELNINGGMLLSPIITIKLVKQVIKNYIKYRFK